MGGVAARILTDPDTRAVHADWLEEQGRLDAAEALRSGQLGPALIERKTKWPGPRTRIEKLSAWEKSQMAPWAQRWIEIGLRTGPADRPRFESAVAECYRHAGLAPPKRVIWVPSPMVLALAATIAMARGSGAVRGAVRDAVNGAVRGAVNGAVRGAVRGAVDDLAPIIQENWHRYIGGQFWVGWWWGGPAYVSFFLDVCGLKLSDEMTARARAYAATAESACWWWPHRDWVMVSERPTEIHRDSDGKLHREDGLAVAWPDGWGVRAVHGRRQ